MIIECPACRYHYDVSEYKQRERLRCRCGQILVVPTKGIVVRKASTLHCANCGGTLDKEKSTCPYCSSLIDLTSARLNTYCPYCLSHSPESAKYCSGCGRALVAVLEEPVRDDHLCPVCRIQMRSRSIAGYAPLECPACCGLFVSTDDFEGLVTHQARYSAPVVMKNAPEGARLHSRKVRYYPCPYCEEHMNRVNYDCASGVIIDYCVAHGYWFDAGEIEKVAKWVATGGGVLSYAASTDDRRFGRASIPSLRQPKKNEKEERLEDRETMRDTLEQGSLFDLVVMTLLGK